MDYANIKVHRSESFGFDLELGCFRFHIAIPRPLDAMQTLRVNQYGF
jgi:hypothetical protein